MITPTPVPTPSPSDLPFMQDPDNFWPLLIAGIFVFLGLLAAIKPRRSS